MRVYEFHEQCGVDVMQRVVSSWTSLLLVAKDVLPLLVHWNRL